MNKQVKCFKCEQEHNARDLNELPISSAENMGMCSLNVDNNNHIPIILHQRHNLQQQVESTP